MREQEGEKVKKYIQGHSDRKILIVNFPIYDFLYSWKKKVRKSVQNKKAAQGTTRMCKGLLSTEVEISSISFLIFSYFPSLTPVLPQ